MLEILDPTNETKPTQRPRNPRPSNLETITIGLLDISKMQGDIFLNEMAQQFEQQGLTVKRYQKPTYAHPAPIELQQQIATECDIVLEALAD